MDTDNGNVANVKGERRKLETEVFSYDGQKHDLMRKKMELVEEITHTKREISRLESEMTEKLSAISILDHRIAQADDEITRLKRKINSL